MRHFLASGKFALLTGALLLGVLLTGTPAAQAQNTSTPGADPAAARCVAMPAQDFSQILDAPAVVKSAIIVTMNPAPTRICKVDGFVRGNDGFSLALPLHGWNGKYAQGGCAGACGVTTPFWCFDAVKRGYAV